MKINELIKDKRQELGLTQAYIADYLGVSVQAVSKWEKGASYPDIILLPVLARLLKMDLNTLFSFNESLTESEINQFLSKLVANMKAPQDFDNVFEMGIQKVRQYPNCELLARNVALLLEQFLIIHKIENRSKFQEHIDQIYEKVLNSNDQQLRNETILIRIPFLLEAKDYDKAETMINGLPDSSLDKRVWQAEVYLKQERFSEAEEIYEKKLIDIVDDLHMVLWGLSLTSIHQNQFENADYYANTHKWVMKLFDLPDYTNYIVQLDITMARKDVNNGIHVLKQLFNAFKTIHEPSSNPFRLVMEKYNTLKLEDDSTISDLLTDSWIKEIKHSVEFESIRHHSEFDKLILAFEKESEGEN